jgi:hypothetical protein
MSSVLLLAFLIGYISVLGYFYFVHRVIVCLAARHESTWEKLGKPVLTMDSIDKWGLMHNFIKSKAHFKLDDTYLTRNATIARTLYLVGFTAPIVVFVFLIFSYKA